MKQTMELEIKVCTENIRTAQYSEDAEECLRKLLALRDQELLEKIEGMRKEHMGQGVHEYTGYNRALTDVSEVVRKGI